jgi:hypothetical protein
LSAVMSARAYDRKTPAMKRMPSDGRRKDYTVLGVSTGIAR